MFEIARDDWWGAVGPSPIKSRLESPGAPEPIRISFALKGKRRTVPPNLVSASMAQPSVLYFILLFLAALPCIICKHASAELTKLEKAAIERLFALRDNFHEDNTTQSLNGCFLAGMTMLRETYQHALDVHHDGNLTTARETAHELFHPYESKGNKAASVRDLTFRCMEEALKYDLTYMYYKVKSTENSTIKFPGRRDLINWAQNDGFAIKECHDFNYRVINTITKTEDTYHDALDYKRKIRVRENGINEAKFSKDDWCKYFYTKEHQALVYGLEAIKPYMRSDSPSILSPRVYFIALAAILSLSFVF